MKFGDKLKHLTMGMKLAFVAKEAKINAGLLNNYINRGSEPSASTALKIARVLKVPVECLIDDTADWPPEPAAVDAQSPITHWGSWIIARSEAVGFRSQKELAKAVGCTEDRLSRWVQMPRPPRRMLKGFDAKLAAALNMSREIIFVQWQSSVVNSAVNGIGGNIVGFESAIAWFKTLQREDQRAVVAAFQSYDNLE